MTPPKPPAPGTGWTAERVTALFTRLAEHIPAAQELRHRIHAEPRVSGDEQDTTDLIVKALGLPATPVAETGALVRIGDPDGPAVGIRAELDALPVHESSEVGWRSVNDAMHACGHDVHMAAAYAVARTLEEMGGPLPLLLVLQPREETLPSGAKDVVTSEQFQVHDVRAFVGLHVQPRLPAGCFSAIPGPVNAAADEFEIRVQGRPGHAAYPHLTADPVVAAADLIGTLQHLISRQVDPTNPTVLTVGSIEGGNSPNVVPACVTMKGILRTFDEHDRTRLHGSIEQAARAVAEVHGCDAGTSVTLGAPVLDNDTDLATAAAARIERAGFTQSSPLRSCGADDFSYFCPVVPSLMVFLGVGSGEAGAPGLHHPGFLPGEEAVADAATTLLAAYLGACDTVLDLPDAETPLSPATRADE